MLDLDGAEADLLIKFNESLVRDNKWESSGIITLVDNGKGIAKLSNPDKYFQSDGNFSFRQTNYLLYQKIEGICSY